MSLDIDKYLVKTYDKVHYTCLHFARDVWFDLSGVDIIHLLESTLVTAKSFKITRDQVRAFVILPGPKDPCIVLMKSPFKDPHLGVYYAGRVLQLRESGADFFPLEVAAHEFKTLRFFIPCKSS